MRIYEWMNQLSHLTKHESSVFRHHGSISGSMQIRGGFDVGGSEPTRAHLYTHWSLRETATFVVGICSSFRKPRLVSEPANPMILIYHPTPIRIIEFFRTKNHHYRGFTRSYTYFLSIWTIDLCNPWLVWISLVVIYWMSRKWKPGL